MSIKTTDVIWQNTIDNNTYQCQVLGVEGNGTQGLLAVAQGNDVIHEELVPLSYGAIFGPDVADVASWEERIIDVIDNPENRVYPL